MKAQITAVIRRRFKWGTIVAGIWLGIWLIVVGVILAQQDAGFHSTTLLRQPGRSGGSF